MVSECVRNKSHFASVGSYWGILIQIQSCCKPKVCKQYTPAQTHARHAQAQAHARVSVRLHSSCLSLATGAGGVDDVVGHLRDNEVQYILIRIPEFAKDVAAFDRRDGKIVSTNQSSAHYRHIHYAWRTTHAPHMLMYNYYFADNQRYFYCVARTCSASSRERKEAISSWKSDSTFLSCRF